MAPSRPLPRDSEGRQVIRFDREEFISERWDYQKGDHVSWIGITGSGKTTLMRQLLAVTATPSLPAVVLAVKPRDSSMRQLARDANLKTVTSWPPIAVGMGPKPNGYVHWPKHTFDPDRDEENHRTQFRRAILDSYRRGNRILVFDEALSITGPEMRLHREAVTVWSKGRAMGCGLWAGTQKPTHVPLWMYSQAQHVWLMNDPDSRSRKRLSEIGGIDPRLIVECMSCLQPYEWIYIRTKDRRVCVVGA